MPEFSDQRFARRAGAVLVVERDPESLPAEKNEDYGVGDAIDFLRAAGGNAEPLARNAVVAIFDDAESGVTAATRLHARAPAHADEQSGTVWRAGLLADQVLLTGEGTTVLAVIDRATNLARLARPGTTAVTAGALPLLGRLRDAVLEPLEKGTLEGRVYLVVPRYAPESQGRRLVLFLLASVAAGGAGSIVWIAANRERGIDERRRLTLGVGPFRSPGSDDAVAWIGPTLRDGLNTQLSELRDLRVFSDEFMDFVMSHEHLTTIELAGRLGIEKMLSGTVLAEGDRVRVEVRIIDVASGVLEGAQVTSGRAAEFLALEQEMVLGVISKLDLHLSLEDEERLAARRRSDLDALRRLLDSEEAPRPGSDVDAVPPDPGEPHSKLWDRFGPRAAWADEAGADILAFLEAYRRATEARDVAALAALYVEFSPDQRAALQRYFESVRDLHVEIDRVEADVVGDEAVVSYQRRDDFIDVPTGREQRLSVRLTKTLRRIDGAWRFKATR